MKPPFGSLRKLSQTKTLNGLNALRVDGAGCSRVLRDVTLVSNMAIQVAKILQIAAAAVQRA